MAKALYELASELGMRAERLKELLDAEGYVFDSVVEEIAPELESEIRSKAKSFQSSWGRMKKALGAKGESRLLDAAFNVSDEELRQLESLIEEEEGSTNQDIPPLELAPEEEEEVREPPPRLEQSEMTEAPSSEVEDEKNAEEKQVETEEQRFYPELTEEVQEEELESTVRPEAMSFDVEGEEPEVESEEKDELLEALQGVVDTEDEEKPTAETVEESAETEEPVSPEVLEQPEEEKIVEKDSEAPVTAEAREENKEPNMEEMGQEDTGEELAPASAEEEKTLDAKALLDELDQVEFDEEPTEPFEKESTEEESFVEKVPEEFQLKEEEEPQPEPSLEEETEPTVAEEMPEEEERPVVAFEEQEDEPPADGSEGLEPVAEPEEEILSETQAAEEEQEGDPPLSADDLLEQQLAAFDMSGDEEDVMTLSVEDLEEEFVTDNEQESPESSVEEEQPEPSLETVEDESLQDEQQPAQEEDQPPDDLLEKMQEHEEEQEDTLSIEDLLGADEEKEEEPRVDESLMGLEFSEEDSKTAQEKEEQPAGREGEGIAIEELLGMKKEKDDKTTETEEEENEEEKSRTALLAQFWNRFGSFVRGMKNPYRSTMDFLQSLNNLELTFLCLITLTLFTGGMYALHLWVNIYQSGKDVQFYEVAETFREIGRYGDAIENYEKVLNYHPDSEWVTASLFGTADSYYQQENYRDAIPAYEKALEYYDRDQQQGTKAPDEFPDYITVPEARLNLTRSLLRLGYYERAKKDLLLLAQEYPGEEIGEKSRIILGDLYTEWAQEESRPEKYENALSAFELALQEYPDSRQRVEVLEKLADGYRSYYKVPPEMERQPKYLQQAAANYEEAIRLAQAERRPYDHQVRLRRKWADTQVQLGSSRKGIEEYERLLQTDLPLDVETDILEKTARAYLIREDYEKAEDYARRLIDHNPGRKGLALAYFILGDSEWEKPNPDYTRMMKNYQKALELDEDSGESGANSQRAFMRMTNVLFMRRQNYEEAAKKYDYIIDRYPNGPYTYRAKYNRGVALENLNRFIESAEAYNRCIQDFEQTVYVDPRIYRDALFRKADSLRKANRWDQAIEGYQDAIKNLGFPETDQAVEARRHLAQCYLAKKDYPRAEKILVSLRERFPRSDKDGEVSFLLAEVREKMFDDVGAQNIYLDLIERQAPAGITRKAYEKLAAAYLRRAEGAEGREAKALRLGALSAYTALKKQFPSEYYTDLEAGKIYRDMGNLHQARNHLQGFLERATAEDAQAEATVLLGDIALENAQSDQAMDYYELVDRMPPVPGDKTWRAKAHYQLGELHRQAGRLDEAREEYESVLTNFGDTPWAREAKWKLDNVDWKMKVSRAEEVGSS